jgi:hypothetical protein
MRQQVTDDALYITKTLPFALVEVGHSWIDGDETEFPERRNGRPREGAGYVDDMRLIHAVPPAGFVNRHVRPRRFQAAPRRVELPTDNNALWRGQGRPWLRTPVLSNTCELILRWPAVPSIKLRLTEMK